VRLEDPKALASLSDDVLDWLIRAVEASLIAEGGDPDAVEMVVSTISRTSYAHGYPPMAADRECGCGACGRYRAGR
jgi:hypothetical protein